MAMWRTILFFVVLAFAGLVVAWAGSHLGPVTVRLDAREYDVDPALVFSAVVLVIVAVLVFTNLAEMPRRVRKARGERRRERGLTAITRGMVAVAAGDIPEARRNARTADRLLEDKPLALLLSAQAAQLGGDERAAEDYFTAMLAQDSVRFLGLRGLFILANRRGDHAMALSYLKQASELRPGTPWVTSALFELHAESGRWDQAALALADAERARVMDHSVARRRRAVLLAAEANEVVATDKERARTLAEEAARLSPGLTPAVALAARLLGEEGKIWRALGMIEDAWSQAPHPELAAAYARLKPEESSGARASRMMGLAERNPNHIESRLLTAEQWLHLKDWAQARAALGELPERIQSSRLAALMADVEQGQGDFHAQRHWMTRALHAPRDPQWICEHCRSQQQVWSPLCARCEAFDSLSWRVSNEEPRLLSAAAPADARPHPEPVRPAAMAASYAARKPASAQTRRPSPFAAMRAWFSNMRLKFMDEEEHDAPVRRAAAKAQNPDEEAPIIFVSPRPPDDPGPDENGLMEAREPARW